MEERIKEIIKLQKMKAGELIKTGFKRKKGYPSELENHTYEHILEMAKKSATAQEREMAEKARIMRKLIEQNERLGGIY